MKMLSQMYLWTSKFPLNFARHADSRLRICTRFALAEACALSAFLLKRFQETKRCRARLYVYAVPYYHVYCIPHTKQTLQGVPNILEVVLKHGTHKTHKPLSSSLNRKICHRVVYCPNLNLVDFSVKQTTGSSNDPCWLLPWVTDIYNQRWLWILRELCTITYGEKGLT